MKETQHLQLRLIRDRYSVQATSGKLFVNGVFFGYTLEDTVRAHGIKVIGHTAIPAYIYQIKINYSNHFKRRMCLIYNQDDGSIDALGVQFTGIRFHGGNRHTDTSGCILIARNRISDEVIQGSLEKELTCLIDQAIESGKEVVFEIINS
ncbi:DUF5675 family protein [Marinifilum sp.]|uniref:DUF5675 family protein n=1 Tax=Marinifilum sp. TaxID=2033137 RepID=UPI003BA8D090